MTVLLAATTLLGCASNRFQLANRRTDQDQRYAGNEIVPPVPQPAIVPQPAPIGQTVQVPGPVPQPGEEIAIAPAGQPLPTPPPPSASTAGPVPANVDPLVDSDYADLLPTNPNMNDTGARNRRRVTEIPKPGPPGTSMNLAATGPEFVGRVLDAFGRPVPYASVQVTDVTRGQIVAEVASATQGVFHVRNLIPGVQYQLVAAANLDGRRLVGSTLAVPPNTAVIIQVEDESAAISQRRSSGAYDASMAQTPQPRFETGPVARVGYGYTYVSTPPLLENGLVASTQPVAPRTINPSWARSSAPVKRSYQVPDRPQPAFQPTPAPAVVASAQPASSNLLRNDLRDQAPKPTPAAPKQSPQRTVLQNASATYREAFVGSPLATMELLTTDGQSRPLGQLSGELILLDFFGSWCGPCRQCVPKLNEIYREYQPLGLQLVGIACEHGSPSEAVASALNVRRQLNIEYPVLVSPMEADSPVRDHFNVTRYPTLVLLDRSGRILFEGAGGGPATFAHLRRAIEKAL